MRYYIDYSVTVDQPDVGMPFGDVTVGIVDEWQGGVIAYVHVDAAQDIVRLFNREAI